jgi:hypothetical protein
MLLGGLITWAVSAVLLAIQNRRGQRSFERIITGMLAVIFLGFVAGLFVSAAVVAGQPQRAATGVRRYWQRAVGRGDAGRDRDATRRVRAFRPGQGPARPTRPGSRTC